MGEGGGDARVVSFRCLPQPELSCGMPGPTQPDMLSSQAMSMRNHR